MPRPLEGWLLCNERMAHLESEGSDREADVIEVEDEEEAFSPVPAHQDADDLELDDEPVPRELKRSTTGVKRERDEAFLDLADFFGSVPRAQQISICRAYGSYLASLERASKPVVMPRTYHRSGLFKKTK